jgi:hypothetical protein
MRSDHREENLVPIEVLISASISDSDEMSTGTETREMVSSASFSAALNARMMTTGWMFRSSRGREYARISPAERGAGFSGLSRLMA